MLKAIILDFDGVLVESNDVKTGAFADLFAGYPPYSQAMMAHHLSHQSAPRREKFRHFATALMGLPAGSLHTEAVVDRMADRFSELVVDRVVACSEVPGASDFIDFFHVRCPLFLSSNTPQDELLVILEQRGISPFFRAVYGNPPVPKAEAIGKILAEFRLEAATVMFVGDAPSDYDAARRAGIGFVGRDSGLFPRAEFPLFPDMTGVLGYLRQLTLPEAAFKGASNG